MDDRTVEYSPKEYLDEKRQKLPCNNIGDDVTTGNFKCGPKERAEGFEDEQRRRKSLIDRISILFEEAYEKGVGQIKEMFHDIHLENSLYEEVGLILAPSADGNVLPGKMNNAVSSKRSVLTLELKSDVEEILCLMNQLQMNDNILLENDIVN
mmetsp:Transcript_20836/g.47295  ORF Transcript_20836/g.47295 Transcript_20836/m.47295 type:complete len:153 (-) Transcript_20836:31-489(-)